jgi:hypothetical protein
VSKTTQTFRDIAADQAIAIAEGSDTIEVLHHQPIPLPPAAEPPPRPAASLAKWIRYGNQKGR